MASSLLDQYRYTVSDIRLLNPPTPIFYKPIFLIKFIKITDGDNELLRSIQGTSGKNQVVWNEQTLNGITPETILNLKIFMKRGKTGGLEAIGDYTNTVFDGLLEEQKSSGICKVTLDKKKSQLHFTVKADRFKDMLDRAKQQSGSIFFAGGESWSTFLTYFEIVGAAACSVSSIHPYIQGAWSILTIVPNILKMHVTRNISVKKLLQRLMDIYKYINEADRLPVLTENQNDHLKLLIDKTCECADFIQNYAENGTAENFTKGPNFDIRILEFHNSFDRIFKNIQDSLIIGIGIAASNIEDSNLLDGMPYADNVGLVHGKKCLKGTRQKMIKEILEWVDNKDTPERVLILSGQAGTGKSAVAHTVAEFLDNQLGSFFCFSRSDKGRINFLFSTISRDLADCDVLWRRNLVQAVKKTATRKSLDPETQFNEMIMKPSKGIKTTKRVVIIIDALDESGDQTERQTLLNLLFTRSSELPSNYRIIITSRPEQDIEQFHQHPNVFCKYMTHVDPEDTLNDIRQFISTQLSTVAEILDMVDKNWRLSLAQKAQGLFLWAKITCAYILELKIEAAQRLRTILSKPTCSLYEMYHQILDAQPDCQFDSYLSLLKTFVGAIIVSRKPLLVSDLQAFFGPISGDGQNVKAVLKSLNSMFIGINESSTIGLRPIHTSLFDFFLSPEQKPGTPNRYYIDISDQSCFTHACLRVMNEMLQFNICGLETSHLRNRDVPNFDSRVAEAIPSHLSYACCYWAYHLEYSHLNPDLMKEIDDLMHRKLLYFFEVLSLLGEVEHGRSGMQILKDKTRGLHIELAAHAAEASQFAFEFGTMMTESTPHLYLSSLPYISNLSFISQQYAPQYPQLLSLEVGQPIDLQPEIKDSIMHRHPSAHPRAIAFSPQGRQIACGFDNGDLWVWDYVTGEMVSQVSAPSTNKAVVICNVVFALNGELVYGCFQDGRIIIWEAKTNKASYDSSEGFTLGEIYECAVSPDERYIAFHHGIGRGSPLANRVSLYERKTHLKLFEDSSEYPSGMVFSPSGNVFGFQNQDKVLHLWDTQKRTFVLPDVTDHMPITQPWTLKTLNDNYLVACILNPRSNSPKAHEIWDIRTSTIVRRFEPESTFPENFAFSANGEYLLRSGGNRYWAWKMSTGEIEQRSVEHDGGNALMTALSSDSKYITFALPNSTATHVLPWNALLREGEKDLSEDNDITERKLRYPNCDGAWLKGQHLLLKVQDSTSFPPRGYLQVLDTTKAIGRGCDLQINFSNCLLVEVSPEDHHWTIASVDASRPGLIRLWNIDDKMEFILDVDRSDHDGKVTTLAFSTTGDRLMSGDTEGHMKVWDVRTRQLLSKSPGGLTKGVTAFALSSTDATFFVAFGTGKGAFMEERAYSELQIVNGPLTHHSTIHSIFVSLHHANNVHVCSPTHAGSELCLKDLSNGANIECFNTRLLPRFSPNRNYIAWIPEEGPEKVNICDLQNGSTLDEFSFDGDVMTFEFHLMTLHG